ncbi:hypothetical protein ACFMBG_07060 [Leisingera sp. D0M16]|uniref:hypothetical protein n=1 Tax=Leisingera coralii TaxID=3351347 RepID=UPI003B7F037B
MGGIPKEIGAGLTFRAVVALPNLPAPEWSLTLHLRGNSVVDLASSAEGVDHLFEAAAAVTAAWQPGRYAYEIRATDGSYVRRVERGELIIAPDLSAQGENFDSRDHVQKVLDAIEAVIENRATIDQQSYQINNRSLQRTPLSELLQLRARYRAELAAKKNARRGFGRVIKVRMR